MDRLGKIWRGRDVVEGVEDLLRRLEIAEAGLKHFWTHATCPCGARIESPNTHPHVGGCPVGIALEQTEEEHDAAN